MPNPPAPSRAAFLAVVVGLALTLSGCALDLIGDDRSQPQPSLSPQPVDPPAAGSEPPRAGLGEYYQQQVAWEDCREDKLCGTVEVPLDYAKPRGEAVELALLKAPAGDPDRRIGSLVVNPGGPGGSGIDYAAQASTYFGAEVRRAFDIVGFDPRGVGQSTPVDCLSDGELDEFVATDPDPDTAAERQQAAGLIAELGRGCVEKSGPLAAHISTEEVARDIDIIRAAVGDERLHFFGASYGTLLGANYAEMFPGRVGRMVLDGAIDPSLSLKETTLAQARGFEVALRAYVGACVDRGGCFLGDSVDAGAERIGAFLDQVDEQPLPGPGGRQLTAGNAVLGIWAPLYNEGYWSFLDTALQAAFAGNGQALLSLSDAYTSRGPEGYLNNSLEALYAVNCLDTAEAQSIPMAQVPAQIPQFEKVSPTFGSIFAYGLATCETWPASAEEGPEPLTAEGAAPILVVGTTRDPATPLEWAEALASQLESGILVRRDGDGHTGYNAGNQCVDDVVESYLVSGKTPKSDVSC